MQSNLLNIKWGDQEFQVFFILYSKVTSLGKKALCFDSINGSHRTREKGNSWSRDGNTEPTPTDITAGLAWWGELGVSKLSTTAKIQTCHLLNIDQVQVVSTSYSFCSLILLGISKTPQQSGKTSPGAMIVIWTFHFGIFEFVYRRSATVQAHYTGLFNNSGGENLDTLMYL